MGQPVFVSRATPPGRGAVATVLVHGPGAVEIVERRVLTLSGRLLSDYSTGEIAFGQWSHAENAGEEVVIRCLDNTRVEVHCHGGMAAVERIVESLRREGCTSVGWKEMLGRAEHDPLRHEARQALAASTTLRAAKILLDQLQGALRTQVDAIEHMLQRGDTANAVDDLDKMLSHTPTGLHLIDPWRVVAVGPPNVGKSSLVNALVGHERAIVFDQPGTTRDVVSTSTAIAGWPVELSDTAGLCSPDNGIEKEGVERAIKLSREADLILLVFDVSQPWADTCQQLVDQHTPSLVVHNKSDLRHGHRVSDRSGLLASALTGDGIRELCEEIGAILVADPPAAGQAVPFTNRQVQLMRQAVGALHRAEPMLARALRKL